MDFTDPHYSRVVDRDDSDPSGEINVPGYPSDGEFLYLIGAGDQLPFIPNSRTPLGNVMLRDGPGGTGVDVLLGWALASSPTGSST